MQKPEFQDQLQAHMASWYTLCRKFFFYFALNAKCFPNVYKSTINLWWAALPSLCQLTSVLRANLLGAALNKSVRSLLTLHESNFALSSVGLPHIVTRKFRKFHRNSTGNRKCCRKCCRRCCRKCCLTDLTEWRHGNRLMIMYKQSCTARRD